MNADARGGDRPIDVLLVDDDPSLRGALVRGLKRHGFAVSAAATADDALRLISDATVPIDVVVMDIVLPDSWGSQIAMEHSLFRPDTPVLFISGHSREDLVLDASSAQGEIAFLEKPFTVPELVEAIRDLLSGANPTGDA